MADVSSNTSSARSLDPLTVSGRSPSTTSSGPRIRNSTPVLRRRPYQPHRLSTASARPQRRAARSHRRGVGSTRPTEGAVNHRADDRHWHRLRRLPDRGSDRPRRDGCRLPRVRPAAQTAVALKLVAPELALDERFRERFARETELAMSLEHPNVVPIYDAGDVDGRLYLAMRLVVGTDLGKLLRAEGALEPARAVAICRQAAARWTPPTPRASCTGTSSPRTCCWTRPSTSISPTSG